MSSNQTGLNAGVPTLAAWPNMATAADIAALQAQILASGTSIQQANADFPVTGTGFFSITPLKKAVLAGETWHIRWKLYVQASAAASTAGFSLRLVHPGGTQVIAQINGTTTSRAVFNTFGGSGVSPISLTATLYGAFDTTVSGGAFVEVEATIRNVTANGDMDLQMQVGSVAQIQNVKDGSVMLAWKI